MKNEKLDDFLFDLEYYCWHKPKEWYYNIKNYISNRILFNKVLWDWRAWDSAYQVDLFKFGLEQLAKSIENGIEEPISRGKKVAAINKLITELSRDVEDEAFNKVYTNHDFNTRIDEEGTLHFDAMNQEDAQKLHNEYIKLCEKEHKKQFDTIFRIIRGQSHAEQTKAQDALIEKLSPEEKEASQKQGFYNQWAEAFDGTGIFGWWE